MFKVKTNRGDHLQIHLKVTIQISQRLQADLKKIKKIKIRRSRIILRTMIMIRNSLQQTRKKRRSIKIKMRILTKTKRVR